MRKYLLTSIVVAALLCAAATAQSQPPSSTLALPGLEQPVRIVTDRWGIPHLYAETLADLYQAWGFVTARDRLWQLEYSRRGANGTLSDWFGNRSLRGDGGAQLFELRKRAEAIWASDRNNPLVREALERFAAGVNAYIGLCRAGERPWPEEFEVLKKRPDDWHPIDSIILLLGQGVLLDLAIPELSEAGQIRATGLAHVKARHRFDADRMYSTIPDSAAQRMYGKRDAHRLSDDPPALLGRSTTLPGSFGDLATLGAKTTARLVRRARAAVGPWLAATTDDRDRGASNVFAVGARRSANGKPLLANDLHLALATPGRLHVVHVHVPGEVDAIGAGVPGLPVIVSGRNREAAWGVTSLSADMLDVYADSLSGNGREVLVDGTWETIREAPFAMKYRLLGLKLPTLGQKRRYTSRGPVLSIDKKRHVALSVRWSLDARPITLSRLLGLERSQSAAEVTERCRTIVTPGLNVVAADVAGTVLYQTVGALPRRGFFPRLGTLPGNGYFNWQGFIAPEDMPAWSVPPAGFVVNGNNLPVGHPYPEPLPRFDWSHDRALRMSALLEDERTVTLDDMARIQNDDHSLRAARFAPLLVACLEGVDGLSERERTAVERVRQWDFETHRDRVGVTIYRAWLGALQRRSNLRGHLGLTAAALDGRAPEVLADPETQAPETPAQATLSALRLALTELEVKLGVDMSEWRWGRAHQAQFSHALKWKDATLEPPLIPADGDGASPTAGASRLPDHTLMTHGPVVRHIVDLALPDSSLGILPPGNSGDRRSPHARDHLERWANHEYVPFLLDWNAIVAAGESETRLTPSR